MGVKVVIFAFFFTFLNGIMFKVQNIFKIYTVVLVIHWRRKVAHKSRYKKPTSEEAKISQ